MKNVGGDDGKKREKPERFDRIEQARWAALFP